MRQRPHLIRPSEGVTFECKRCGLCCSGEWQKNGKICGNFDTAKRVCLIYEQRPEYCRLFPFIDGGIWALCPGIKEGIT